MHDLFGHHRIATDTLRRDQSCGRRISALRERLYLPGVSQKTAMLQEWMSQDGLGETTHRHLSPLVGFFPGDRITRDESPANCSTESVIRARCGLRRGQSVTLRP